MRFFIFIFACVSSLLLSNSLSKNLIFISGTPLEQEQIASKMRDVQAFHAFASILRAPESDVDTMLAVSRAVAAAATTSAQTRDRIRYVGGVGALLARCDPRAGVDDRVRLASLRALASLVQERDCRTTLRRADGLARLIRLFSNDTALPLQLLAVAIVAQLVTGSSSASASVSTSTTTTSADAASESRVADALEPSAIADTIILLLQRSDDERIVSHGLKLLTAMSQSVALAKRAVEAEDGRAVRALSHFCQVIFLCCLFLSHNSFNLFVVLLLPLL